MRRPEPAASMRFNTASFVYHRLAVQASPLRSLPLLLKHQPAAYVPAFLPHVGLASFLAPLLRDGCARSQPGVLIAELPTTPVVPVACGSQTAVQDGGDWPTSLTPGHNKNALYGPEYSPRRDGSP